MKQNIYDNDTFFQQYQQIRSRTNNYNRLLEQPHFYALLPSVTNKVILDIGCGAGDFAAHCVTHGAKHVTGIDISANMIALAKARHTYNHVRFEQIAFEDMPVQPESADIITSSLAFHYIADFSQLIQNISATLCDGGTLLFSTEHPIETANKQQTKWLTTDEGEVLHFAVDHYQHEGMRTQNWLVDDVIMYHRTMSTMLNTLIEHDLHIERVVEPVPTAEAIAMHESLRKEFRRPSFLMIRARKQKRV